MNGSFINKLVCCLILCLSILGLGAETRIVNVDFYILLDVSLSMEGEPIKDAREFTASNIIGDLIEPDDWLCLITFWGDSRVIWQEYIKSASDKVQLIRQLSTIQADGRFTDIGRALDQVSAILDARADTDRPKYILLITDEIQEAVPGTPYYAEDNVLRHHMLDYVRRIDRGLYRVITVGHPQRASIEESARQLYELLANPPSRPSLPLPGAPPGQTEPGNSNPLVQQAQELQAASTVSSVPDEAMPTVAGTTEGSRKFLLIGLPLLAGLLMLVLIAGLVLRRKNTRQPPRKEDPVDN